MKSLLGYFCQCFVTSDDSRINWADDNVRSDEILPGVVQGVMGRLLTISSACFSFVLYSRDGWGRSGGVDQEYWGNAGADVVLMVQTMVGRTKDGLALSRVLRWY